MKDRLLCVGGMADGKWIEIPKGQRELVFNRVPESFYDLETHQMKYRIEREVYERLPWHCEGHEIEMLVPKGTSGILALHKLMENYKPR
jgi:hypothetical protein